MAQAQETVLEINLNNLTHNFKYLKSRLNKETKVMAVVKAFAYGSDANVITGHLQDLDIDYFAVAYTNEGVALRDAGITKPILVLHPQSVNFKTIIDRCLEPSLYSPWVMDKFIEVATENNQVNYPVHIKFNTGLNRLGFNESEVEFVVETLQKTKAVKAVSIFSHLAASEDEKEKAFTLNQINTFKVISEKITSQLGYQPLRHLCNTSGILNYPDAHFEMIRTGIGLYGFGNSAQADAQLKPIATLKTIISQVHELSEGDTVGYNRVFKSDGKRLTATLPIGHADGLGRQYGLGKGYVTIHGHKAPIIGNVCMDMVMVDITDIPCKAGDEVVVFGEHPTASDLAESAGTISYEIITSISQRVNRVFIK
ncbi:alanine racemase [Mangrovimonas aestuarii]|uniref:alanine racemase n=1 Tax=Mangrovimonas aestuarii TaxID=3018443 RepID=UPI002378E1BC|nr:alanine racemase [Mangrovimonas aestuarii]